MPGTAGAEGAARRHEHARLLQQVAGKAAVIRTVLGRNRRPDEHRGSRRVDLPAQFRKQRNQKVAARLVCGARFGHTGLVARDRGNRRLLNGQEHAVVEVRFQRLEHAHHLGVAQAEAYARARHAIRFAQGIKLHAHVLGAREAQKAPARFPVKDQVAVGVVVQHDDVVLLGKGDQLFIESVRRHRGGGVIRVRDDHQLGSARVGRVNGVKIDQIAVLLFQGHIDKLRPRHARPARKRRIARVRHEHRIARVCHRQADMRQPLLRAQQGRDLGFGVQRHAVAPCIPLRGRLLQRIGVADCVDVIFRVSRGLGQRLADMRHGRDIRRAHAQVDHTAAGALLRLFAREQLRKNAVAKLFHSFCKLHVSVPPHNLIFFDWVFFDAAASL